MFKDIDSIKVILLIMLIYKCYQISGLQTDSAFLVIMTCLASQLVGPVEDLIAIKLTGSPKICKFLKMLTIIMDNLIPVLNVSLRSCFKRFKPKRKASFLENQTD